MEVDVGKVCNTVAENKGGRCQIVESSSNMKVDKLPKCVTVVKHERGSGQVCNFRHKLRWALPKCVTVHEKEGGCGQSVQPLSKISSYKML